MGWAQNFASETPLKKFNWSSTTFFRFITLCIWPAQNPKNPGISFLKIPGFSSTSSPGIPGIPLRPAPHTGPIQYKTGNSPFVY